MIGTSLLVRLSGFEHDTITYNLRHFAGNLILWINHQSGMWVDNSLDRHLISLLNILPRGRQFRNAKHNHRSPP